MFYRDGFSAKQEALYLLSVNHFIAVYFTKVGVGVQWSRPTLDVWWTSGQQEENLAVHVFPVLSTRLEAVSSASQWIHLVTSRI